MKKLFLALLLLLATATCAFAAEENGLDQSKTPWGQPIQETAKVLGATLKEGATNIVLKGPDVFGYKSVVLYLFEDNKLVAVSQIVAKSMNATLDEEALKKLFNQMGQSYDKLIGKSNRVQKKYYAWLTSNGDYLFLNDENKEGRVNLRRMPKEIWEKYWAPQFKAKEQQAAQ